MMIFRYVKIAVLVAGCFLNIQGMYALRLDHQWLDSGKLLVRNHGYDGSHVLFALGCATEAVNLISFQTMLPSYDPHGNNVVLCGEKDKIIAAHSVYQATCRNPRLINSQTIAVIGNDIISMSTAFILSKFGYAVCLYGASIAQQIEPEPHCMHEVKTAQAFSACIVDSEMRERMTTFTEKCMHEICTGNAELEGFFKALEIHTYGVTSDDVLLQTTIPFSGDSVIVVDLPVYTADLYGKLRSNAYVTFIERAITTIEEVQSLTQDIIVDCIGLS